MFAASSEPQLPKNVTIDTYTTIHIELTIEINGDRPNVLNT